MKHIFKHTFVIILTSVLFLASCQKDQTISEEETQLQKPLLGLSGKHVQGEEFFKDNKDLDLFLRSQFDTSNQLSTEDVSSNNYGFTIQTNDIQVISNNTYTSYTFKVLRDSYDLHTAENYILTVYNDGSYSQLLATYPLEEVDGKLRFNMQTATVQNIIDDSLVQTENISPCTGTMQEIVDWDASAGDCINFSCQLPTGDGTHGPDEACDAQGADRAYEVCSGGWVVTGCIQIGGGSVGGDGPFGSPSGGGNDNPSDNDPSEEEVPLVPVIPVWQQIVNCMNSNLTASLNGSSQIPLSNIEVTWLQNATRLVTSPMDNYLDSNLCSNNAVDFNDFVIDDLITGNDVDYEEEILYDQTLNNRPCQKEKMKKSYTTRAPLATSITQTFGTSKKLHLRFKEANLPPGISATTGDNPNLINCSDSACIIDVFFDTEFLDEATDMAIVVNTLHESIHAMFLNWAKNNQINLPVPSIELNYKNLLRVYLAYIEDQDASDYGTVHHTELINFIGQITIALMKYGEDNGYDLDQNYYERLAWYGLDNTPEFDTLYPAYIDHDHDSQTPLIENAEKIRILLVLQAERNLGGNAQILTYPNTINGETITVTQKGSPCQ